MKGPTAVPNEIDMLASWAVDVIPPMGVATFTYRLQRLGPGPMPGPKRETTPIAFSLKDLKELRAMLDELIPAMEELTIPPHTGGTSH